MGCRTFDASFFQLMRDHGRAIALHAPIEDSADNSSRFFINDPVFRVIRIFRVAIRRMCCQILPGLTLLSHSSDDLLAGILHIELVDDVQERREVIILLVGAVHTAVDGNEANVVLGEHHLGIEADLKVSECPKQLYLCV